MTKKPTYEELEKKIRKLEQEKPEGKKAEKMLSDVLAFNKKIFFESPFGISVYNAVSGQCVAANKSIADFIGASEKQVLAQNFNNIQSWKKSGLLETAKSALRDNLKKQHEVTVTTTFGKTISIDCRFAPFSVGNQKYLLLTLNDVTERKQAEEALQKSEEKFRILFNKAGDSIFIHDDQARMLAVNFLACDRLGYSHTELMSMTIDQVDTPEEAQFAPGRIAQLMEQGSIAFETHHQCKDGLAISVEVNARLITWNDQPAMMSICRDITKRKQAEEELKKNASELEDMNTALKVLLKKREQDKDEIEERIFANYQLLLLPIIRNLKKTLRQKNQQDVANILESELKNILSPFSKKLSDKMINLTPTEIHVADLIKLGKSNKEISEILNSSYHTIARHRDNIRIKTGLKNKKINLRSFLLTLQ